MSSPKSKILLLITNLGPGGAQRVFSEQSLFLKEQYEVSEVTFDKNEFEDIYKTGNLQYSLNTTAGNHLLDKIKKLFARANNLNKLVKKEHATLCISHMDGANWVNILSRSTAKKILVVHGTVLHDFQISPFLRIVRKKIIIPYLYKKADCVVAVSEGIKHELTNHCHLKNVIAIPNAFKIKEIQNKAQLPLDPKWESVFLNNDVLITSGRMHEQKKQRYLLPLFKNLSEKRKSLKLIILGDGELRDALIDETKKLGLKTYTIWNGQELTPDYDVYFPGYLSNPFQFLKRSTLFLFSSGWEGFPLALCEAMISGVPVLSTDCPTGPREILAPDTFDATYSLQKAEKTMYGYLMPMVGKPTFTLEWINAIEELLKDKEKRILLINKSLERMQNYDKSVIVQKWYNLIDNTIMQ